MAEKYHLLLVAGGNKNSTRFGSSLNKVFIPLGSSGRCALERSVQAFAATGVLAGIWVAAPRKHWEVIGLLVARGLDSCGKLSDRPVLRQIQPGLDRNQSVQALLESVEEEYPGALVAIHDAARPLVNPKDISLCLDCLGKGEASAAVVCEESEDSLILMDESEIKPFPRNRALRLQTPCIGRAEDFLMARRRATEQNHRLPEGFEDASLMSLAGMTVKHHLASTPNFKITHSWQGFSTTSVITYASQCGKKYSHLDDCGKFSAAQHETPPLLMGYGYDSHRFDTSHGLGDEQVEALTTESRDPDRRLLIGGVDAGATALEKYGPFVARSDGDLLMHAAVNAILSALGDPAASDIGQVFSNLSSDNSGRDSAEFLEAAVILALASGYRVEQLRMTVKGKVRVSLEEVRRNLCSLTLLDPSAKAVTIQGTSGENMDGAGRGEGMEAFGMCVLRAVEPFDRSLTEALWGAE